MIIVIVMKLPFEYFIRTNCGAEYMRQYPPNLENVIGFGFLVGDNLPGPFHLELDYMKVGFPFDIMMDIAYIYLYEQ